MIDFQQILLDATKSRKWKKKRAASDSEIAELILGCPYTLPSNFIDFLKYSSGGIGSLPTYPHQCLFFAAANLLTINKDTLAGHKFFVFGTNGAGIHLALRIQETAAPIVWIEWPYGASDCGQILANDFESFVRLIGA